MAREPRAERDRRVIAQEDTNLFGGSFTPFRDLWNTLAGDLGITTKRMRNDAMARAAEEEAIWRDTGSALTAELERQRGTATNPRDLDQLRTLETQLDLAGRMRQSSNPRLAEAGVALLGKVTDEQRAFNERQETQSIAADTQRAAIEREVGAQGWSRMQGIADDLRSESSAFLKQRDAWGAINASLSLPPSHASDLSLLFRFMKVLDPESVVREGEFATAQNAGGVPTIMLTAYNHLLRDGQRLTPGQRQEYYDQARAQYLESAGRQRERNGRYLDRARAGDVPEKYYDSLTIPVDIPETPVQFGNDGMARPVEQAAPGAPRSVQPTPPGQDGVPTREEMIGESISSGVATAADQAAAILAGVTGLDVRKPLAAAGKATRAAFEAADAASMPELAESIEADEQGMSRGVYVPEFMRRRRAKARAVNP